MSPKRPTCGAQCRSTAWRRRSTGDTGASYADAPVIGGLHGLIEAQIHVAERLAHAAPAGFTASALELGYLAPPRSPRPGQNLRIEAA